MTIGFGMGMLELGDTGGIVDPIGHASIAIVAAPLELEVVADVAPWGDAKGDPDDPNAPRRVARGGTAVRWDFATVDHDYASAALIAYADAGMGWEHAWSARASADRGDVEAGAGFDLMFRHGGRTDYGMTMSLHALAAPATDATAAIACHAACAPTGRGVDVGVVFDMGFTIRR